MDLSPAEVAKGKATLERNSVADKDGHRMWMGYTIDGQGEYGVAHFQGSQRRAHRLSYQLHMLLPELATGIVVRHLCGNSLCVEPSHLSAGTAVENVHDKIGHGTSAHGKNTTLEIEVARAIKLSKGEGFQRHRASRFGVSVQVVRNIDAENSWAWLGSSAGEDNKNIPSKQQKTKKRKIEESLSGEELKKARAHIKQRVTNARSLTECAIWQGSMYKNGYGRANFSARKYFAHRLSYCAYNNIGTIPAGMVVRHKCKQTKGCVNPMHLELGTQKENAADRVRDNTVPRGETHYKAKITEDTARSILHSKGQGTANERAARFGATLGIVQTIDSGTSWRHLSNESV